jgi:nucleotidyltransferase/DNA polymerase involved in DNA repair
MKGLVGCLRVAAFAAQVEARDITGSAPPDGLPIVIVDNERVTGAAPVLLAQGARIGMTVRSVRALRPDACFVAARPLRYREVANSAHARLLDFSPAVELDYRYPAGDLYAYCDLGPVSGALAAARRSLNAVMRQLDLAATVAVAANKYAAWCAAQSVPVGQVANVPPGRERDWLAPLPLTYLPLEAETERRLRLLGLRTLGAFAALSGSAAQTQFGRAGLACWRLVRGLDERPVLAQQPERCVSITRSFDDPLVDRLMIEAALARVAQRMARELAQENVAAGQLLLALGTADRATQTAELALRQPLTGAQLLAKAAGSLLNQVQLRAGVVEATLTAGHLQPLQPPQLDLFAHGGDQVERLSATLAAMTGRYQGAQILAATVTQPSARLPERRFSLRPYDLL